MSLIPKSKADKDETTFAAVDRSRKDGSGDGAPKKDAAPSGGGDADAERARIADGLARLSSAVDGMREQFTASEERIGALEEQMTALAGLAERLSADYSPFAEASDEPTSRRVTPRDAHDRDAPVRVAKEADPAPVGAGGAPHDASGDVLLYEWSRFLVASLGPEAAKREVTAYQCMGWLDRELAERLEPYVAAASVDAPAGPRRSRESVAWWSRMFLERLATVQPEVRKGA